jgi:hypothetical protein
MAQQPITGAAVLRFRRLLRNGYFPSELPPPFTTQSYASHASDFAAKWDGAKIRKFWTSPEHYTIPRYGQVRRKLSIVNPINQLHVAQLVAENWDTLRQRLERSKISEFRPRIILLGGGRAVSGVNFEGVAQRRTQLLASYGRYVKTDIARFYPSVYTHSIAWAALGKDWVKQNFSTPQFKTSYANLLDKAVAAGQAGQWVHYIRTFELSDKSNRQREELDSFFEQAFYLADNNPRENVLLFSARRAASFDVAPDNKYHLVRWLLYAARRSTTCLSFIVQLTCPWVFGPRIT